MKGPWYDDDKLLPLSGIQHFHYCKRQWALIHIECEWADDLRTTEGHYIHRKADDSFFNECRKDRIITRSVPIISQRLGLQGIADVVEYKLSENGICLSGRNGLWQARPVEYKRGRPKVDERDEVQLCAQAMCLEEMMNTRIEQGDMFYHEIRRRVPVTFTTELRDLVISQSNEMHSLFIKKVTPPAERGKRCQLCSLNNTCMPKITKKRIVVSSYIRKHLREASTKDV